MIFWNIWLVEKKKRVLIEINNFYGKYFAEFNYSYYSVTWTGFEEEKIFDMTNEEISFYVISKVLFIFMRHRKEKVQIV